VAQVGGLLGDGAGHERDTEPERTRSRIVDRSFIRTVIRRLSPAAPNAWSTVLRTPQPGGNSMNVSPATSARSTSVRPADASGCSGVQASITSSVSSTRR
jgi:hypothetical protein